MNLTFRVNKDTSLVFDYLTDMQKFVSVHPVISKIDNLSANNYLVYETLKIGFIPFSFRYHVTIENSFLDKIIVIRATVFKFTKIEMKFNLQPDSEYTIVKEEICFKSLFPVKFLMKRVFKKQHKKLFQNIGAT